MKVKTFVLGPIQTSCYVVSNDNCEAIIIDVGGDPAEMVKYIKQHKLNPLYLVNTHGHIDHILGNPQIKEAFPQIKICIHPDDAPMFKESKYNLACELGFEFSSPAPDKLLNEGDTILLGKDKFSIIHLPGHTKGGIGIFYHPNKGGGTPILFSGDAIFAGSIGRTDFPGSSHPDLISNIQKKIFNLPEDTIIYPGHGPATTVGEEKHSNPFF